MSTLIKKYPTKEVITTLIDNYSAPTLPLTIYTIPNYPQNESWYINGFLCLNSQLSGSIDQTKQILTISTQNNATTSSGGLAVKAYQLSNEKGLTLFIDDGYCGKICKETLPNNFRYIQKGKIIGSVFTSSTRNNFKIEAHDLFIPRNTYIVLDKANLSGFFSFNWFFVIHKIKN